MSAAPRTIFLVAGESSGDLLGARLMAALKARLGEGGVRFLGVGGPAMAGEGLETLFPVSDIAVMGPSHIIPKLPLIFRRLRQAHEAVVASRPDALVVIDSPEFTQRLAKRARKSLPLLPIVKYVAPQVWAWRRGRAPRMRAYIDHVMALLPFEPAFYAEAGGPPTTYVGHPMLALADALTPNAAEAANRARPERPTILVLPGSRLSEINRLLKPFGETLAEVARQHGEIDAVIPAVPHLAEAIAAGTAGWAVKPRLVLGEPAKHQAMREARVALAASGTVTLELALAGVPTVVAYRMEPWITPIGRLLVKVPTIVLANLVLGGKVMPEFLQGDAEAAKLAPALLDILRDSPARAAQLDALAGTRARLELPDGRSPADVAAGVVLDEIARGAQRRAPTGT